MEELKPSNEKIQSSNEKKQSSKALLYCFLILPILLFALIGIMIGLATWLIPNFKTGPNQIVLIAVFNALGYFLALSLTFKIFKPKMSEYLIFEKLLNWKENGKLIVLLLIVMALNATIAINLPQFFKDDMYKMFQVKELWQQLIVFMLIVISAPLFEEALVRGFLYQRLSIDYTPTLCIIISAVFFAFLHLPLGIAKALIILPQGLVFSYARHKSGGIITPIILHMINNSIAGLALLAHWWG